MNVRNVPKGFGEMPVMKLPEALERYWRIFMKLAKASVT
jgi:hypothetical protein